MKVLWCDLRKTQFISEQIRSIEAISGTESRKYLYEKDTVRHLVGLMLAEYGWWLITKKNAVRIIKQNSKPYYEGLNTTHNLYFNITHSEDIVVCAINSANVGIDTEKIDRFPKEIIDYYFTDEEKKYCQQDESLYYKIWTHKECYLKTTGEGIRGLRKLMSMVEFGKIKEIFCGYRFMELYIISGYETVVCSKELNEESEIIEVKGKCLIDYLEMQKKNFHLW